MQAVRVRVRACDYLSIVSDTSFTHTLDSVNLLTSSCGLLSSSSSSSSSFSSSSFSSFSFFFLLLVLGLV